MKAQNPSERHVDDKDLIENIISGKANPPTDITPLVKECQIEGKSGLKLFIDDFNCDFTSQWCKTNNAAIDVRMTVEGSFNVTKIYRNIIIFVRSMIYVIRDI